jgi:hypothetical protein
MFYHFENICNIVKKRRVMKGAKGKGTMLNLEVEQNLELVILQFMLMLK